LHEEVFQRIGTATSELTQHEASIKNAVFMITAVENMSETFDELKNDYTNRELTFPQTHDAMQMLLGEIKQFQKLLSLLDGNDIESVADGLQADIETYLQELAAYGAQSAVLARATEKGVEMKQLLEMWYDYEGETPEVQGSAELSLVYKSIEDFISDLENLEMEPSTTATELEAVLGTRRIVTDVQKFYASYTPLYYATVLGLFAYYKSDKDYRSRVSGDQKLGLRPWDPASSQQDRGYVVYSGTTPLGPNGIDPL
jgi:hypothetical protein